MNKASNADWFAINNIERPDARQNHISDAVIINANKQKSDFKKFCTCCKETGNEKKRKNNEDVEEI